MFQKEKYKSNQITKLDIARRKSFSTFYVDSIKGSNSMKISPNANFIKFNDNALTKPELGEDNIEEKVTNVKSSTYSKESIALINIKTAYNPRL